MAEEAAIRNRLGSLRASFERQKDSRAASTFLQELINLYGQQPPPNEDDRREIRLAFLDAFRYFDSRQWGEIGSAQHDRLVRFVTEEIRPLDFARLYWPDITSILEFTTNLSSLNPVDHAQDVKLREHIRHVIRLALRQFEKEGRLEEDYLLLQQLPLEPSQMDDELYRLRHRATLYEDMRIEKRRRLLYIYLALQLLLVFLIFPLLFISVENRALPPENAQITYLDALYWSLITATSIGYGDLTPVTVTGKILASALGLLGVITVGIIAGLILEWLSPRRL